MSDATANNAAPGTASFHINQVSEMMEIGIIYASSLTAIPLFFLDRPTLGHRRYAWLVALGCSLYNHGMLREPNDENVEQWTMVDRLFLSMVCIPLIPHMMQMMKQHGDDRWLAMATLPPLCIVVALSCNTPYTDPSFWQLRSFLFLAVFMMPYLNHLTKRRDDQQVQEPDNAVAAARTTTGQEEQPTPAAETPKPTSPARRRSKRVNNKKKR